MSNCKMSHLQRTTAVYDNWLTWLKLIFWHPRNSITNDNTHHTLHRNETCVVSTYHVTPQDVLENLLVKYFIHQYRVNKTFFSSSVMYIASTP